MKSSIMRSEKSEKKSKKMKTQGEEDIGEIMLEEKVVLAPASTTAKTESSLEVKPLSEYWNTRTGKTDKQQNFTSTYQARPTITMHVSHAEHVNSRVAVHGFVTAVKGCRSIDGLDSGFMLTTKKIEPLGDDEKDVNGKKLIKAKPVTYSGETDLLEEDLNGPVPFANLLVGEFIRIQYYPQSVIVDAANPLPRVGDVVSFPNVSVCLGRNPKKENALTESFHVNAKKWSTLEVGPSGNTSERISALLDSLQEHPCINSMSALNAASTFGYARALPHEEADTSAGATAVKCLLKVAKKERARVGSDLSSLAKKTNSSREHVNVAQMITKLEVHNSDEALTTPPLPNMFGMTTTIVHRGDLHSDIPSVMNLMLDEDKSKRLPNMFPFVTVASTSCNDWSFQFAAIPTVVANKSESIKALRTGDFDTLLCPNSGTDNDEETPTLGAKIPWDVMATGYQCSDKAALASMAEHGFAASHWAVTFSAQPAEQDSPATLPSNTNYKILLDLQASVKQIGIPVTHHFVEAYLCGKGSGYLNGRWKTNKLDEETQVELQRVYNLENDGVANLSELQGTSFAELHQEAVDHGKELNCYVLDGDLISSMKKRPECQSSHESGDCFLRAEIMAREAGEGVNSVAFDHSNPKHIESARKYLSLGGTAIVYGILK